MALGRGSAWQCVAVHAMDRYFAWQAWHLSRWAGSGGALGSAMAPLTPTAFCVAGVALRDI